jgi:hypothetical protein
MRYVQTALTLFVFGVLVSCSGGKASVAGKWTLDRAEAAKQIPADDPMAEMMKKMVETMDFSFDFQKDGTVLFAMKMEMMGMKQSHTGKGTWKLEGEKLTITPTEEDGKPPADPTPQEGILKDGVIRVSGKDGSPDLVLRRA